MRELQDVSIQYIKGVGPARKKLFYNLGIDNVEDLLYFFPRRYEDRSKLTPLCQVQPGESQTITGIVKAVGARKSWHTRKHVTEVALDDGSGKIVCVWFNMPYLLQYFRRGKRVVLHGKAEIYKNRLQMVAPEYEIIEKSDESLSVGRIVPVYPLTKGMTQRYIRRVVKSALDKYADGLQDILPVHLRNRHKLANISRSIKSIHYPENESQQEEALRRVSFEEFFLFQLSVIRRRMSIIQKPGVVHTVDLKLLDDFKAMLPFELTSAQKRVANEIIADMQKSSPMLRLLQGDVGSGKTLVAFLGCLAAYRNGRQSAIMVPTEILARQHEGVLKNLIKNSAFKDMRIALLVNNLKKAQKENVLNSMANGSVDLIIGTHALISEEANFSDLSYVIIDEQHKFGVRQRALLSAKGTNPDILVMTATPIPRTLSITLFGDLDVSIIDEMPRGRGKVTTMLYREDAADEVYGKVYEKIKEGQQAYIIYPIIEESEKLDLKAAEKMYEHFKKNEFKGMKLGIVHGQMKKDEADSIMRQFKNHTIDILVATTVLEVGVDVPNANVMVVEHADRFGLSQLHQLRGRIGRGSSDAACFLIADPTTDEGHKRLEAIVETTDGFKIAEQDLLIRGPGHYFGRHQHGLNELKFSNPATQVDILQQAREEASGVLHSDPNLGEPRNRILKETIQKRYPHYLKFVEAG